MPCSCMMRYYFILCSVSSLFVCTPIPLSTITTHTFIRAVSHTAIISLSNIAIKTCNMFGGKNKTLNNKQEQGAEHFRRYTHSNTHNYTLGYKGTSSLMNTFLVFNYRFLVLMTLFFKQ